MSRFHPEKETCLRQTASATLAGTRLWAPFPVRPFLSTYTTRQLSNFVRTYVDEPFASKFASFVEAVGMTGRAFVDLDDNTLERLCRKDLDGLFELQSWKTTLKKPTTPRIQDIFELPPTSPSPSSSCSPCPSSSPLAVGSTPPSELETPDWDLEDNSLFSTPESSEFPFEDPAPWSEDDAGEEVDIIEVAFDNESPLLTRCPIKDAPTWPAPPAPRAEDAKTPRLSRASSSASLRSVRILNFEESASEELSPTIGHLLLQGTGGQPDTRPPSSPLRRWANIRSDPPENVLGHSVQAFPQDSSHDPPGVTNASQEELSLLRSFFYEDVQLRRDARLPYPASRPARHSFDVTSSLLMQAATSTLPRNSESFTMEPQDAFSDPEETSSCGSLSPDPWDAALDLFDEDTLDDADSSITRTSESAATSSIPAIIVGDAPLSQGKVIVKVDARLPQLLDDPSVELSVVGDDRIVTTPRDLECCRSQVDSSIISGSSTGDDIDSSEEISSDLEDDLLLSPAVGLGFPSCHSVSLDSSLFPLSPTLSDHLPFFTWDKPCFPSPPPPTSILPSTAQYPPTPATFSRRLSEVLIRNRALTGGSIGIEILPDLTIVRAPVTVCLRPPFSSIRAESGSIPDPYEPRPKLEIMISHDSLLEDKELSALISPVALESCYHYENPWPTPVTLASSISPSPTPLTAFAVTPHSPSPMHLPLPFANCELDEGLYTHGEMKEIDDPLRRDCPSLETGSPILNRAVGFFKAFMTPIDPTPQDRHAMYIPGTYEPIFSS